MDEFLERYKPLKFTLMQLHSTIHDELSAQSDKNAGKKLGLMRKNVLTFETESQLPIFQDYCLYDCRVSGKNAIQRYAARHPQLPDSIEKTCLDAMLDARFSVYAVQDILEGYGVMFQDIFTSSPPFLLMDIALGNSCVKDTLFAGRILPMPDFSIATGAMMPLQEENFFNQCHHICQAMERKIARKEGRLTLSDWTDFSTRIIKAYLRSDASEYVKYV